jgi:hypothetical protein
MVEAMNNTYDKAAGLAIPEGVRRRVGPRPFAEHERAWSHTLQRGHNQVMDFSPFFLVYEVACRNAVSPSDGSLPCGS